MKRLLIMLVAACALLCSCSQMDEPVAPSTKVERVAKKGVLCLPSQESFASLVDALKAADTYDINDLPKTRTDGVTGNEDFVSLRQHLIDQGLREFTDEELAEIIADSLIYDPEDSLIVDPYMMAMLDADREVQIGDKVYRFINEGLLIYDAPSIVIDPIGDPFNRDSLNDFSPGDLVLPEDGLNLAQGEMTLVQDANGNTAELYGVDYGGEDDGEPDDNEYMDNDFVGDDGSGGSGSSGGGSDSNDVDEQDEEPGLLLCDGNVVPGDKINFAHYEQGEGDGSWISKGISRLFDGSNVNVVVVNKFNSRHRLKLRMYDIDYIIYESCGMTVRFQKRTLGIWWRRRAEKLYFGWSPLEIENSFPYKIFFDPGNPPAPEIDLGAGDAPTGIARHPEVIKRKMPFSDEEVALFYVHPSDYDFQSGNVDGFFMAYESQSAAFRQRWFNYLTANGLSATHVGFYTASTDNCKMLSILPPQSFVMEDSGREAVTWEELRLGMALQFFFSFGDSFSLTDVKLKRVNLDVKILRGGVYGAAKYNNEFRACMIGTK